MQHMTYTSQGTSHDSNETASVREVGQYEQCYVPASRDLDKRDRKG
jgi:hypothetical protein